MVKIGKVGTAREAAGRADGSRRLTILSPAERLALYGLPDFDDFQRSRFFAFTVEERALAAKRKHPAAQLHCMLQIGYFKAKKAFFDLTAGFTSPCASRC